jgi:hypothetical protein
MDLRGNLGQIVRSAREKLAQPAGLARSGMGAE